jgi:type IV pilus assembly protein PilO
MFVSLFMLQSAWFDYRSASELESQLRGSYLSKKNESVNLDIIKKQLIDTQQTFGFLLKKFPDRFDSNGFISASQQFAKKKGFAIQLMETGIEKSGGVFTELPIHLHISGKFDDIGNFVAYLSDNKWLSRINEFEIFSEDDQSNKGRAMKLQFDFTVSIYRYIDEDELAAQKRSSRSGSKK